MFEKERESLTILYTGLFSALYACKQFRLVLKSHLCTKEKSWNIGIPPVLNLPADNAGERENKTWANIFPVYSAHRPHPHLSSQCPP